MIGIVDESLQVAAVAVGIAPVDLADNSLIAAADRASSLLQALHRQAAAAAAAANTEAESAEHAVASS